MFTSLLRRCRTFLASRAASPDGLDWKMRRAPLPNVELALQSETHEWLRRTPRWLHPTQLCRHYPRLANRVARNWADAPQVARLLSDLMIDGRGNRHGFAPRIHREIERLYRHNAERMNPLLRRPPLSVAPGAALLRPSEPCRRADSDLALAVQPLRK